MNTAKIATTNEKLLSMKLHLQLLQQVSADSGHRPLQRAYTQALSFHFKLAYVAFLQEIAADYHVSANGLESFEQLESCLDKTDIVCQQCSMLAELEQESLSWLSAMLRSYQSCWPISIASAPVAQGQVGLDKLIQFSDVTEPHGDVQYQKGYQQLNALIQQYRELMQEW